MADLWVEDEPISCCFGIKKTVLIISYAQCAVMLVAAVIVAVQHHNFLVDSGTVAIIYTYMAFIIILVILCALSVHSAVKSSKSNRMLPMIVFNMIHLTYCTQGLVNNVIEFAKGLARNTLYWPTAWPLFFTLVGIWFTTELIRCYGHLVSIETVLKVKQHLKLPTINQSMVEEQLQREESNRNEDQSSLLVDHQT